MSGKPAQKKASRGPDLKARPAEQPFQYPLEREFVEPDWKRLPGYRDVSREDWESALWQRRHSVKNLKEFKAVFQDLFPEDLHQSIERDMQERATMSMLMPPRCSTP